MQGNSSQPRSEEHDEVSEPLSESVSLNESDVDVFEASEIFTNLTERDLSEIQ